MNECLDIYTCHSSECLYFHAIVKQDIFIPALSCLTCSFKSSFYNYFF